MTDTSAYDPNPSDVGDDKPDHVATLQELLSRVDVVNLATDMKEHELSEIGTKVCREAEIDDDSRDEWSRRTKKGMELALQETKPKTFPWPNAANIRAPILTTAAIQFAARAYPAIVAGNDVVKAQITGSDPGGKKRARADRIAAHMSWQCLTQMPEWEPGVDTMLHNLPIVGCAFKKTYFDVALNRNRSDYISALDLIVNMAAQSLEVAPRVTQVIRFYPHQIQERFNSGVFLKFDYGVPEDHGDDEDAPHEFFEQHRRLDLDEDGYAEPYVVTVHKETEKVCRIVANYDQNGIIVDQSSGRVILIEPKKYFTKVPFIPNPDGGFYDIGFAWLLTPLNSAINTIINQLLDAGTLSNTGGGFIGSQLRLKGGTLRFQPGEYKEVDVPGGVVKDNIVTLTFPPPSPVLFQLLGTIVEMAREVASVKDVLTGDQPSTAPATTTLAMIEQGLKVFTAIYKRIHRAMKEEFAKLYQLNRTHFDAEEYASFTDMPELSQDDYKGDPVDIIPVSDPTMVSDMQKLARAEFLKQFIGMPGINPMAIVQRQWDAAGITNTEELLQPPPPGPPPDVLAKVAELSAQMDEMSSIAERNRAQAILYLAQADAAVGDQKLALLRAAIDTLAAHNDAMQAATPGAPNANGARSPAPKNIQSPLPLLSGAQNTDVQTPVPTAIGNQINAAGAGQ